MVLQQEASSEKYSSNDVEGNGVKICDRTFVQTIKTQITCDEDLVKTNGSQCHNFVFFLIFIADVLFCN